MLVPDLEYIRPNCKKEFFKLYSELSNSRDIYLCGGGTDLIPRLKQDPIYHLNDVNSEINSKNRKKSKGRSNKKCLIALSKLIDKNIFQTNKSLIIGAGVTLKGLSQHPLINKFLPILSNVTRKVASFQIRSRATIGGNLLVDNRCIYFNQSREIKCSQGLCYKDGGSKCLLIPSVKRTSNPLCRARFVSDLAPVLILLNAVLRIESNKGTKQIPLREFYFEDGINRNILKRGEFLSAIEINGVTGKEDCVSNLHLGYKKLRIRDSIDFPSLGVALRKDAERLLIVLTGVDVCPKYLSLILKDFKNEKEMYQQACIQAKKIVKPLKQDFFPPSYRKQMVEVFVRNLL